MNTETPCLVAVYVASSVSDFVSAAGDSQRSDTRLHTQKTRRAFGYTRLKTCKKPT